MIYLGKKPVFLVKNPVMIYLVKSPVMIYDIVKSPVMIYLVKSPVMIYLGKRRVFGKEYSDDISCE